MKQTGWRKLAKRALDVTVAGVGLVAAAPALAAVACAIRLSMGSPVLFRQKRPGYQGQPIHIYKFRTMRNLRDAEGRLLPDAARMTALGNFLRRTSLDELPQLVNVLKGDLSLVGPRPLLMQYLPRYSPEQARRHDVVPGITGWTQINGRNALSWEEKFRLDVWYVDNWSLLLDLRILATTALRVAFPQGVAHEGFVTMPEFMGNDFVGEVPDYRCDD